MRTPALLVATVLVSVATVSACSSSSDSGSSPKPSSGTGPTGFLIRDADGETLANAWFELLAQTGSAPGTLGATEEEARQGAALVRPYLDSAFQLQRASGERYTAGTYLPLDIDEFTISDVVTTTPRDDVRVVRYAISTPGAAALDSGLVMSDDFAPRLTTFRWDDTLGHWVIVSHANYNVPVAAICDQDPIPVTGEAPATAPDDLALGTTLVSQWRDITTGASKAKVRHPEGQIQLADGQGWPSTDGSAITRTPATGYEYDNLSVTRNEDLIVLSYDAVASDLQVEGAEYRATAAPRLLTYLLNDEGTWEQIALANFTVPSEIPASVDCVSSQS